MKESSLDSEDCSSYGGGASGTNNGSRGRRGRRVLARGAAARSRGRPGPRRPRPSGAPPGRGSIVSSGASDSSRAAPSYGIKYLYLRNGRYKENLRGRVACTPVSWCLPFCTIRSLFPIFLNTSASVIYIGVRATYMLLTNICYIFIKMS